LVKYLVTVRALEQRFMGFTLKYIPRAENSEADEQAKAASNNLPIPDGTFYHVLQAQQRKQLRRHSSKSYSQSLKTRGS
jgi:hypothetical protein